MAKKSIIAREKKRERLYEKYRLKKVSLIKEIKKRRDNPEKSWRLRMQLQTIPRDASPCRRTSRCFITGRAHAVYSRFGLSRIKIREHAMRGEVPGVIKSSW